MVLVLMDDREPRGMEEMAELVDKDLTLLRMRLDEGDYVWDDVCIERKQIDDFCGSIMDGRLKRQAEKMKEKFGNCYVIVVGRIKDRTSEIHENCILGKYLSLVMKSKIPVLFVDDEFQFLYLVKRIVERHKEMRDKEFVESEVKKMEVEDEE